MTADLGALKRTVVLRPTDPGARVELAQALLDQGDRPGAIAQLEKAISAATEHWPARRLLARAYSLDQRLAEAHVVLTGAVRLMPTDLEVRDEMIEFYLAAHRLDDALVHAREITRLHPEDPKRWHALGLMLAQHLLYQPAVEALQRAAALAPAVQAIANDLELVSRELSQLAGSDLSKEVALSESLLGPLRLSGPLEQAARLLGAQDVTGAKRVLVTAPAPLRETSGFFGLKGEIAWTQGDRETARQAWGKVAMLSPTLAAPWRRTGDVALVERQFDVARQHYAAALDRDGSDLELRALLHRVEGQQTPGVPGRVRKGRIGVLAWNPVGGSVSPLQAVTLPGKGEVVISGNLGDDLRDSATLAHSFVRQQATALGLAHIESKDLHFHDVVTDTRKQGRSAGLAFALASISAFRDEPLPPGLAATGEITLLGEVVKVAGIHEKVIAAYLLDYTLVFMPRQNLPDARTLPPEVTSHVKFVFVDTILEAFRILFPHEGAS